MPELTTKIKEYRAKFNMKQGELAEKVGVSRVHISFIEAPNMVRPFSIELLFKIAKALNVEPAKLLKMREGA